MKSASRKIHEMPNIQKIQGEKSPFKKKKKAKEHVSFNDHVRWSSLKWNAFKFAGEIKYNFNKVVLPKEPRNAVWILINLQLWTEIPFESAETTRNY